MKKTFLLHIKKPKNIVFLIFISFFVFIGLRIFPVYEILNNFHSLPDISLMRRLEVFYQYVFEPFFDSTFQDKFITITLSLLTSINILFFIIFAKKQRKFLAKRSFIASLSGMFLGLFGVGCISCGAFVLIPIITFFGLGAYITQFIEYAPLISSAGIVLVIFSIFYLLKQISKPNICS